MLTKIVYDKYWRSWFLHDYKASSGEEAIFQTKCVLLREIYKKAQMSFFAKIDSYSQDKR